MSVERWRAFHNRLAHLTLQFFISMIRSKFLLARFDSAFLRLIGNSKGIRKTFSLIIIISLLRKISEKAEITVSGVTHHRIR